VSRASKADSEISLGLKLYICGMFQMHMK